MQSLLQTTPPDPKPGDGASAAALSAIGKSIPGSPLDIIVYDDGSLSLREVGKVHFFGARASGVFLWVDNAVYGPNVPAGLTHVAYTVLSHSGPSGSGVESNPWRVSTLLQVGNTGIRVQQEVTYVNGARNIGFEWHLSNESGIQRNVTLFHVADLYVDGNDFGIGYVEPGKRAVGGYNQSTRIHGIFTPITPPDAYEEHFYKTIWERIGSVTRGIGFLNTIQTNYMDNGAGLQWNFSQFPGNATAVVQSRFSVAPLDTSDSQFESPPTEDQIRNNPVPKMREFEFVARIAHSSADYKTGPITFSAPISRYYGDIGEFLNYNQRFVNLVAPKAQLTLRVFDVDSPAERYTLNINGKSPAECHVSGDVRGSNGAWLDISLTFDSKCLKFPNLPTPTGHPIDLLNYYQKQTIPSGLRLRATDNQFELAPIDSAGDYKALIAWARLTVGGVRPVLFSHGINGLCEDQNPDGTYNSRLIGDWENWIYDNGLPGLGVLVDGTQSLSTQINQWGFSYFEAQRIFGLRTKDTIGVLEPDRLLIVGHSMGGLMARGFTAWQHTRGNLIVEKIAAYGTPNAGANIAAPGVVYPYTCSYLARQSLSPDYIRGTFNQQYSLINTWQNWSSRYGGSNSAPEHFFAIAARYLLGSDNSGDDVVSVENVHWLPYDTEYQYVWTPDKYPSETIGLFSPLHTTIPSLRSMYDRVNGQHPNYPNDSGLDIGVIIDPLSRFNALRNLAQARVTASIAEMPGEKQVLEAETTFEQQTVAVFTGQIASGTSTQQTFQLDETNYIGLRSIPYTDNSNVALTLIDPNGNRYNVQNASFYQENVDAGVWKVEIQGVSANGDYSFQIETGSQLGLTAVPITANGSNNVVRGASATIGVQINDGNTPLSGLSVQAEIALPDGQAQTLALNDTGQNGDAIANDGIYSAGFQTDQSRPIGAYLVNYVIAGNRADGRAFQRVVGSGFTVLIGQGLTDTTTQWITEDADGDTLIDVVHSHIVVNPSTAGAYFVVAGLKDNISGEIIGQTSAEMTVSAEQVSAAQAGIAQDIDLEFGGNYLGGFGTNLNLSLVNVSLYNTTNGELLDYRSQLPGQINISPSDMESPLLAAAVISHVLHDEDNNGRADALRFTMQTTSRFAGNYTLQATLQDSTGQPFAFSEQGVQLNSGQQNIAIDFTALQLVQNGVAGKFTISNLSLLPIHAENLQTGSLHLTNLYSTEALSLDSFVGGVTLTVTSNMPTDRAYVRIAPANPTNIYLIGTEISLEPVIIDSTVVFKNWLVNGESRTESPLSLIVNSNTTVQAIFDGPQLTTPGDCNADQTVSATDITALSLEFFDGDDNDNPADTPNGSYSGNPGCDANEDTHIGASDITCISLLFFNGAGACSASTASTMATTGPVLAMPAQIAATAGSSVTVPINLQSNGSEVGSLLFSLDYDETHLRFDPADNNQDGIPDELVFHVPAQYVKSVTFDPHDVDGELDIMLASFASPPAALAAGTLIEVTLHTDDLTSTTEAALTFSQAPEPSFGDTRGRSLLGVGINGSVLIAQNGDQPAAHHIYLPFVVQER